MTLDAAGNQAVLDGVTIAYDAMTNVAIPAATQPSVVAGTGAPTFSSIKGTLYLNLTGSTTATRLYINNGTTNWVAITTAS
jgi:hypothetical protein